MASIPNKDIVCKELNNGTFCLRPDDVKTVKSLVITGWFNGGTAYTVFQTKDNKNHWISCDYTDDKSKEDCHKYLDIVVSDILG